MCRWMQHCHSRIFFVAPRRFNFGAFKAVLLHREWFCCEFLIFLGAVANSIARYWFVERVFTIHNLEIRATHLLIGFNRDLYSHSELWTTINIINDGRNIFVDKEFTLRSHWRNILRLFTILYPWPSHDRQISGIHLAMVSTWLIRMLVIMMLPSGNLHHLAMNYPHSQVPKHLHMEDFALPSCVPTDLKRQSIPLRWLRFKDGIHGIWNIPNHQHVILSNISVRKNASGHASKSCKNICWGTMGTTGPTKLCIFWTLNYYLKPPFSGVISI